MSKRPNSPKIPLALQIIVAVILGTGAGFYLGPKATVLAPVGLFIIKLLKLLATPLVFFAVADGMLSTDINFKKALRLVQISLVNAAVAAFICIGLSRLLPASRFLDIEALSKAIMSDKPAVPDHLQLNVKSFFESMIPKSVLDPLISNNIILVVVSGLLFGALVKVMMRALPENRKIESVKNGIGKTLKWMMLILSWVIKIVPLAAFSIVAKVVGTTGLQFFSALGVFVFIVTLGMVVHVFIYYAFLLKFIVKKSPLEFFRQGSGAFLTAMSTGSSLATLPVTLPTLEDKMKITPSSTRLAACVGTNLNHTGILLYEASAVYFIAQIQSIHLNVSQQLGVGVTSALAAFGIAGIPDAGLISLSIVLGAVGLPLSAAPFLMPVDWLLGRFRATVNVTSDMTVAHLLDHLS